MLKNKFHFPPFVGYNVRYVTQSYCLVSQNCTFVLLYDETMHTLEVEIHGRVEKHIGKYDRLLEIVKRRKVRWF